ncbi:MAG: hypothetical protein RI897_3042 [Verrucomicrobiota bacterium]
MRDRLSVKRWADGGRRKGRTRLTLIGLVLGLAVGMAPRVGAILLYETGDPARNTTAPSGELEGSGWQWQGRWGSFLGTPIHPKYFLTAAHVGGLVGQALELGGVSYVTTFATNVPGTDLRLWRICGEFTDYAPLRTNGSPVGMTMVCIGRGTQRGAEVMLTNDIGGELRGWRWGARDGVMRWGVNRVEDVYDGGASLGPLLRATFDADGGVDECHLSVGDSGGAAFVREAGRWELVGIHYAVDGPYSWEAAGPGFNAALFDHEGFFWQDGGAWVPVTEEGQAEAGSLYITDVSAHADWILEYIQRPVPGEGVPFVQRAEVLGGVYRDVLEAEVDESAGKILVPLTGVPGYYRLRGCVSTEITGVQTNGSSLILSYAVRWE